MTSLTPLLWCHLPLYYDVTNLSTMTSLTPLLCRHLPLYYDVTYSSYDTYPLYYDVTNPSTIRYFLLSYDVTNPSTIRHFLFTYDVTNPSTMTSLSSLLDWFGGAASGGTSLPSDGGHCGHEQCYWGYRRPGSDEGSGRGCIYVYVICIEGGRERERERERERKKERKREKQIDREGG